ncbi:CLUMA_CG016992, isoform A [Clunio marinus]|uniref:CLUMA_CG016992, isoform A n=1 Tax=Clunio marinus TaxID=568069 RepID=A0A1J1IUT0_9DIPT|nr:CLUMA_CG016992, isoform A [Clunio marinus]
MKAESTRGRKGMRRKPEHIHAFHKQNLFRLSLTAVLYFQFALHFMPAMLKQQKTEHTSAGALKENKKLTPQFRNNVQLSDKLDLA